MVTLNKQRVLDTALSQLDNIGHQLSTRGITDKVNRHNLVALFMFGEQRVRGELIRLDLQVGLRKNQIKQLKDKADDTIEDIIERAPTPIADSLKKLKARAA